jgi:hypothetical protein
VIGLLGVQTLQVGDQVRISAIRQTAAADLSKTASANRLEIDVASGGEDFWNFL